MIGELGLGPHMLGAQGGLIHARDDGRAAGCADARRAVGVGVAGALGGQGVQGGCLGVGIAIGAEVGTDVFDGKPEDVGPFGGHHVGGDEGEKDREHTPGHDEGLSRGGGCTVITQHQCTGACVGCQWDELRDVLPPVSQRLHAMPLIVSRIPLWGATLTRRSETGELTGALSRRTRKATRTSCL